MYLYLVDTLLQLHCQSAGKQTSCHISRSDEANYTANMALLMDRQSLAVLYKVSLSVSLTLSLSLCLSSSCYYQITAHIK